MTEKTIDKTTRLLVKNLEEHKFTYKASVFLKGSTKEENALNIAKLKRIIRNDNKELLIFHFISMHLDYYEDGGVINPLIYFFSHAKLKSKRLIEISCSDNPVFQTRGNKKTYEIGCDYSKRYNGFINKIKKEKVFDFSSIELPPKVKRYGFLNKKQKKTEIIN